MFFFLSKILSFLLMPLTWFFLLLIWAWRTKDQSRKKRLRIASIVILLVFSNRFIFDRTMHAWEVDAVKEPAANSYDGIIVLGGISSYDYQLNRIQFTNSNDRLMQAIALLKKGVAPKLIFTGGSGSILHPDHLEGNYVKKYLEDIGIPDSQLVFEVNSKNTHENATMTKPLLKKDGKYLLVTSAYHMRRALGCFTKEGINVSPYSANRGSGPWKFEFDYMFLPDAEPLFAWNTLFHEWFGCITYKMEGYI